MASEVRAEALREAPVAEVPAIEIKQPPARTEKAGPALSDSASTNGDRPTKSSAGGVDPNYQYWREHGGEWIEGYDLRKKRQILYHIQELMLTDYILQHANAAPAKPFKVLEFGCGVGRHLRNLTRLPGVDPYGYDQSMTMAEGVRRWGGQAWFDSHIVVGMPTGPLPYPDMHFDIVYSAEVLVHVRPEHIDGILKELVRICRGHILHLETSEHVVLYSGSHDGCWRHDLPAAYARLGLACEVLPSGYNAHTPYRVVVGKAPMFTWSPAILEMYRRLERDIDEGFEALAKSASESEQRVVAAELKSASSELLQHALADHKRRAELAAQAIASHAMMIEQGLRELAQMREELAAKEAHGATVTAELHAARADVAAGAARIAALEGVTQRAQALEAQLAQSNAAIDEAKGVEARLTAKCTELSARVEAAAQDIRTWSDRATELQELLNKERTVSAQLHEQRGRFVESISRLIRP